ncbi:two-component system chemotaxis response regulator CheY [Hydrogenispora ethanolica]|jgi:two-component system chemotaxis response regulator CheY|uniref:Two-component system chemotaxis response regulator CheY n=1 Tax=Hydrogenispora ethanolica TaxID=1082276 RepID=A0A4R1RGE2_HYDET|nr:response regulator [Hydrogenispora ethanolica]TCL64770.1 two-component system chemotaxis response regulator CheY [Hydrogenispora ethanolica]
MKTLIVEDDFVSRRLLQIILAPYGPCDIAVNGKEAIEAFRLAWQEKSPYQLICLDIMMPELGGQEVLKTIRAIEREMSVDWGDGAKIIMTTALHDHENIKQAFQEQCEAYLVKPIERVKLLQQLREMQLID